MVRELEDAKITLKLDTADAKKQLDELANRRPGGGGGGNGGSTPATGGGRGPGPGGGGGGSRRPRPGGQPDGGVPGGTALGFAAFTKNSAALRAIKSAVVVQVLRKVLPMLSGMVAESGRGTAIQPATDAVAFGLVGGARGLNSLINGLMLMADETSATFDAAGLLGVQAEVGETNAAEAFKFREALADTMSFERYLAGELDLRQGRDQGGGFMGQMREAMEEANRADALFGDKETDKRNAKKVRETQKGFGGTGK